MTRHNRPPDSNLNTVQKLIRACGGNFKVAGALEVTPGAVSHWVHDRIPSDYYLVFQDKGKREGFDVPITAFRFKGILWPEPSESEAA